MPSPEPDLDIVLKPQKYIHHLASLILIRQPNTRLHYLNQPIPAHLQNV